MNIKVLVIIDADNIDESYVPIIKDKAECYLNQDDLYEMHSFGDFVKRKQSWRDAYYKYGVQPHYIPGMDRQKGKPDPNTSDIALTAFVMKKLYEQPEIEVVIIVANDKDYAPLAKIIMEEHFKTAIMLYTQPNDSAAQYYSYSELLKNSEPVKKIIETATPQNDLHNTESNNFNICKLIVCIEDLFKNNGCCLLAELGPILKENGFDYGKSLGGFLKNTFTQNHFLNEQYTLKLGDKKDRIERIA